MGVRIIDGYMLEEMLKNGLYNLTLHEKEINDLNVFPVADGDTGTNMVHTLETGVKNIKTTANTAELLKALSEGMLLGARGNSGVILSQFFKGFYLELSRKPVIGIGELRNGLIIGYRTAYRTVLRPVEGTMLTVARLGIEDIRKQISRRTPCDVLLSMYIAEMKKVLTQTPEMLDVLKEANVVDSGAAGFILIFEGMLKSLYGEKIGNADIDLTPPRPELTDTSAVFNEYSKFEDGYCLEFILQLMCTGGFDTNFRMDSFNKSLESYGNSIVAVLDGKLVKVHIHTLTPSKVIRLCEDYGVFIDFKLDNMQIQHNIRKVPKKNLSIIAVSNGEGFEELFKNLGCDVVLDGGTTMNTSSQEFLEAFKKSNAERIVVFPNNPNVILAAKQAADMYEDAKITVIPTKNLAEGYFAIAMDISDSENIEYRIGEMELGAHSTIALQETTASRDYTYNELSCKKGDEISLIDGELVCAKQNAVESIIEGLSHIPDITEKDTCALFRGKDTTEEEEEELTEKIEEAFPNLDVNPVYGGQEVYHWIAGIS